MKHTILITGHPGTGKSTLAAWLADTIGLPQAGYRTTKTEDTPKGPLFCMESIPGEMRTPISCLTDTGIKGIPETFETLGVQHVQEARTGPAPVIILDEIGRFEASCSNFLTEIERALDSEKTVIAVLKKEPLPHLQELAERPDAVLLDLDILSPFQARTKLTRLFWPEKALHWGLTLRLYQEKKSFGPGPMQLLEGVDRTGSLHQAASELGMAYSKAWKLIGSLEHQWGFPLLRRQSGGAKGGGSALTKDGRELLSRYQAMLEQVEAAAQQAFETCFL